MADHSVFINEMMLQSDNGNLDFAYRCARLVADPAGTASAVAGARSGILFYEDGVVQTNFNIPLKDLPPLPLPPPATLMGMLNDTLFAMEQDGTFTKMEEDDVFNESVENVMASLPLWKWAAPEDKIWTLLVIRRRRRPGHLWLPALGGVPSTSRYQPGRSWPMSCGNRDPRGQPLRRLTRRAAASDGNLWEAARDLARHLFASAGLAPDSGSTIPT